MKCTSALFSIQISVLIMLCVCCFSSSVLAQTKLITLQESFQLALERSTSLAITNDQIDLTDAQIKQARAGYFPVLSLQASTTRQAESTNPLAKNLSATSLTTTNINISQNLFQGFRDLNIINQRTHLKAGYEWAKKQAKQQLYQDVAQAFYSLLIFQSDILLYKEQILTTQKRKQELSAAKKSGRARDSDILISKSMIASIDAAVARTEGQMVTYQEAFTFLTGLTKTTKLVDQTKLPREFKSEDFWLENSQKRPDVQQSKSNLLAAEDAIKTAQAGFYPTLGLSANYYLSRPTGIFNGVDWDVGIVISFPFFSGGLTKAQVSEATVVHHTRELNLRLTQELATQTIKTMMGTVTSDFEQLAKFKNAANLTHQSYELVHRDNHLGVATNSDVLMALQNWQESKRNLERTRITTVYDYVRLLVETSKMEFEHE
ncbi:MAG: TolC family protein [Bacteriovoracaceae bacterium]|nr:TolC family protein [Bacteriovoracaceae bacterium]